MILTKEVIKSLRTEKGGFTKATLTALGADWNDAKGGPVKGWYESILGKIVTDEQYRAAVAGRARGWRATPSMFG
jgi:hypothetical protein